MSLHSRRWSQLHYARGCWCSSPESTAAGRRRRRRRWCDGALPPRPVAPGTLGARGGGEEEKVEQEIAMVLKLNEKVRHDMPRTEAEWAAWRRRIRSDFPPQPSSSSSRKRRNTKKRKKKVPVLPQPAPFARGNLDIISRALRSGSFLSCVLVLLGSRGPRSFSHFLRVPGPWTLRSILHALRVARSPKGDRTHLTRGSGQHRC